MIGLKATLALRIWLEAPYLFEEIDYFWFFCLQNRVGIKGYTVAEAVAEAPKGVARALLYMYIVRASPLSIIQDVLSYLSLNRPISSRCNFGNFDG